MSLAPRAITYTSDLQTKAARDAASAAVAPQYDFTPDKAAAVAASRGPRSTGVVAPVDAAFDVATPDADRAPCSRPRCRA